MFKKCRSVNAGSHLHDIPRYMYAGHTAKPWEYELAHPSITALFLKQLTRRKSICIETNPNAQLLQGPTNGCPGGIPGALDRDTTSVQSLDFSGRDEDDLQERCDVCVVPVWPITNPGS